MFRDGDSPQHPARRGAEPRHARHRLRREIARRRGVRRARARADGAREDPQPRGPHRDGQSPNKRSSTMADKRPALGRGLERADSGCARSRRATPSVASTSTSICSGRIRSSRAAAWTRRGSTSSRVRSARTASFSRSWSAVLADDGYEIVAGERRWRASQRAGLLKVPVVVRDIPDDRLLAAALIENIQREDLNPIEEAAGLPPPRRRTRSDPGADRRGGREGSLVDRQLRPAVAAAPRESARTSRPDRSRWDTHARSWASPTSPHSFASRETSSQRTSRCARPKRSWRRPSAPEVKRQEEPKDVHTRAAEDRLRFALGTRTRIVRNGRGGRIEIDFTNENELQRLFEYLTER